MSKKASSDATIRPPYIPERQIEKRFGVSRGTQYRLRLRGIFPPGIRLGPCAVIYSEPEIIEALAKLASGSVNVNLDG